MTDDTEGRENKDVNLRVTKEPEEVLEEHRVTATVSIEEDSAEVTVSEQHSDTTSKDRDSDKKEQSSDQHGPAEERHSIERKTRCSHIEDSDKEVYSTEHRADTTEVKAKNGKINSGAAMSIIVA